MKYNLNFKKYNKNITIQKFGYKKFKINNYQYIREIQRIIQKNFLKCNANDDNNFKKHLFSCQNLINKFEYHRLILLDNSKFFLNLFNVKKLNDICIQSVCYLRGVRPEKIQKGLNTELLGIHRENFYNDYEYINKQINIHIPLLNYNQNSSLKIIPKSHLIEDKYLNIIKHDSSISKIKRFSRAHKLGLAYNPKEILNDDLKKSLKRIDLKIGNGFAFSSRLLHGGSINQNKKIRYSIDFGVVPKKFLKMFNKKNHFSSYHSSKKHFIDIDSAN
jgi:ectoine hydroxylase-related dioxygenase (phytanoyl-CoA dioxygenase family)